MLLDVSSICEVNLRAGLIGIKQHLCSRAQYFFVFIYLFIYIFIYLFIYLFLVYLFIYLTYFVSMILPS
jgi:hypothetical protein